MKMKKKLLALFVLLFVSLLFVACSGGDEDTADDGDNATNDENTEEADKEESDDVDVVKVGYMSNYASNSAVIAGMENGSFEDENIEVELVEFADGPTIIAAMESDSIDVGYIGPGAHVLPIQGEAEIFAWSQLGNADEVIGSKEKGVEEIEDLEGKTIGVASGTSSEMILDLTLDEAGLTQDDVTVTDMDASAIVTAMISGSVDAVATWSPNTNAIKNELEDDAVMLTNNERYEEEAPSIASWVITPGYAEDNEELLQRFTTGLFGGMDYRAENPEEVAEWVAEKTAVDEDAVLEQIDDGIWNTKEEIVEMIENGEMEDLYQKQAENFVKDGSLDEDELTDVEDYVSFDNMLDAAKAE